MVISPNKCIDDFDNFLPNNALKKSEFGHTMSTPVLSNSTHDMQHLWEGLAGLKQCCDLRVKPNEMKITPVRPLKTTQY